MIVYNWEIGYMDYVFRPSPIMSPPFYIEPSETFQFCLQLHPFGRYPLNDAMILLLWRCDSNERSIELRYSLRIYSSIDYERNETYTYNFTTPMQFPDNRVYLIRPNIKYESVLRITCTIHNHDDIFQDVDEDVMSELSSDYELLLQDDIFSNHRVQIENSYFYVHNAILEARCVELATELDTLEHIDPTISQGILQFLYSGTLTTWRANVIPVLMRFGSSLLKTMYPFLISDYAAKTSFVGNCYTYDWVIKDFSYVRSPTIFTYMITEGDDVMQVSFFPYSENNIPNFYIEMLEYKGGFIRCKVDIQIGNMSITLVEISNTETNPSLLKVNKFIPMKCVMHNYPKCVTDGALELKIYIYMCSFNANYTSNVDLRSCMNASNHTIHMFNLRQDFEKLLYHSQYYDFEIIVNYQIPIEDYERHRANYARFHTDFSKFDEDFEKSQAEFKRLNAHYAKFRVHKAILSARSLLFRILLSHDTIDTRNNNIEINDIKPYVVRKMLLFMYCGQLRNLNLDLALDLNYAADKYFIEMLKRKCSEFLESNIGADNVDIIQTHANRHSNWQLHEACIQFRRNNII